MKLNKRDKEFEKYAYGVIKKYSKILLLDKHTFELRKGTEDSGSLMECVYNYPYLNVTFNYGDKVVDRYFKKVNVVPYIVHEMCHPITDPLYAKAESRYVSKNEILDEREKLTDYICNIVIKNNL